MPSVAPFGDYLRILRRRARLTQAELGIAVGYSDAQICRLETGRRPPDLATLVALFLPALGLDDRAPDAVRLLELAGQARGDQPGRWLQQAQPAGAPQDQPVAAPPEPVAGRPALIGRASQLSLIADTLRARSARLLTIVGPAGIGKTHLATHALALLAADFADGARFVDLAPVDDPDRVAQAVLQVVDAEALGEADTLAALRAALAPRRMLLLLDNFEQVAAAAPLLDDLLRAAPGLALLVTSRVALRLSAEHTLHLPPLAVPDLGHLPPLAELAQVESLALLLARLRASNPALELTESNALTLAAICARVDGLPLAIELVAAHGRLFSPRELLVEVAQQLVQMRRSAHGVPDRHRTLAAALAWSYQQLPPPAQALFARLSAFSGGWTVEAAVGCCDLDGHGRAAILGALEQLLDHSLIQRHDDGEAARYSLLVMVRAYAVLRLEERSEGQALHGRMLGYWLDLARRAEHHLAFGEDQARWSARLFAEIENLRAILGWAIAAGEHQRGLALAGALARFWYVRGYLGEGRRWLEQFLALPDLAGSPEHAHALDGAGLLAWRQADYRQAEAWLQQALATYRRHDDEQGLAHVIGHLGLIYSDNGAFDDAIRCYEESLVLHRATGNPTGIVASLHNLGNIAAQLNQTERALAAYNECLHLYRANGNQSGIALILLGVGALRRDQGDLAGAEDALSESQAIAESLGDRWNLAVALLNRCDVAADVGDFAVARDHGRAARQLFEQIGDQQMLGLIQIRLGIVELLAGDIPAATRIVRESLLLLNAIAYQPGLADALEAMAGCLADSQPARAARLLGAAAAIRVAIGFPAATADLPRLRRTEAIARAGLSPAAWQAAWDEGGALSAAQAVMAAVVG